MEVGVMIDLESRYLGLQLRSPLAASASPLTGSLRDLRRLEQAGAGAVVLPSLFQEQLTEEARVLGVIAGSRLGPGANGWALDRLRGYNAGDHGYLTLVERANDIRTLITISPSHRTGDPASQQGGSDR